ncbi:MAG: hypothetical protein JWQ01_953, partial [Massilia sp.]|nr:hypothetical protein [Massilia sp.]
GQLNGKSLTLDFGQEADVGNTR